MNSSVVLNVAKATLRVYPSMFRWAKRWSTFLSHQVIGENVLCSHSKSPSKVISTDCLNYVRCANFCTLRTWISSCTLHICLYWSFASGDGRVPAQNNKKFSYIVNPNQIVCSVARTLRSTKTRFTTRRSGINYCNESVERLEFRSRALQFTNQELMSTTFVIKLKFVSLIDISLQKSLDASRTAHTAKSEQWQLIGYRMALTLHTVFRIFSLIDATYL